MTPIRRLLIANRGEIARRITRSARSAGAVVIAVYAPSDAEAPHVKEADLSIALMGSTAADTYLDIGQILAAARETGADAVHPGYGFLSERAEFASAVLAAGLIWVGPPPKAIAAMGDKLSAKRLMSTAGVPVLPTLEIGTSDEFYALPPDMRMPVIVKASAGGGGKGMRVVTASEELPEAIMGAQREARAYFGDPTVFVEPYIADARHVEIQILADDHGNVVHCFERDCSIQRRHQKVIEEAPSPTLDDKQRRAMGAAAIAAAVVTDYRGAGTVEFVVDPSGEFWFLEVNTRLQVEHPVTEAVTGIDLVREQLQIAAGLPISFAQDDLAIEGHAIEARLYAEDPEAGFLPATGTLLEWTPPTDPNVRWDSGVETGSVVGVEWDPMLAKVIAHAPTRTEAALRLALALSRLRVRGVVTNREFLVSALGHPQFLSGQATTDFVRSTSVALARVPSHKEIVTAVGVAALVGQSMRVSAMPVLASIPGRWHTGALPASSTTFAVGGQIITVYYERQRDDSFALTITGGLVDDPLSEPVSSTARLHTYGSGSVHLEIDGKRTVAHVACQDSKWWVQTEQGDLVLEELPRFPEPEVPDIVGGLRAPLSGITVQVAVDLGTVVQPGELLMVIEAMKMEHRVLAPYLGTVTELLAVTGDHVAGGDLLVVLEAEV